MKFLHQVARERIRERTKEDRARNLIRFFEKFCRDVKGYPVPVEGEYELKLGCRFGKPKIISVKAGEVNEFLMIVDGVPARFFTPREKSFELRKGSTNVTYSPVTFDLEYSGESDYIELIVSKDYARAKLLIA